MSAQPVIDPIEQSVRLEGSVWPFDWDPSEATALIQFGDVSYELNVISWRQKRNLARALARAAAIPLERILLRASLRRRAPLPARADERAALVALCLWLNESPSALPWSPGPLAQATLEICRDGTLAPRDLDDLPAAEVEEMWRAVAERAVHATPASDAARTGQRLSPSPQPRFKRIVVIPDPPSPPGSSGDEPAARAQRQPSAGIAPPDSTPGTAPPEDQWLSPDALAPDGLPATGTSGQIADETSPARTRQRSPSAAAAVGSRRSPSPAAAVESRRSRRFRVRAINVSGDARPPGPPALEQAPPAHGRSEVSSAVARVPSASDDESMEGKAEMVRAASGRAAPLTQASASSRSTPRPLSSPPLSSTPLSETQPVISSPQVLYPTARPGTAEHVSRAIGDLDAPGRPAGRAPREDRSIEFIDERPFESAASGRYDDGLEFEDELRRAAVEAGIDEA